MPMTRTIHGLLGTHMEHGGRFENPASKHAETHFTGSIAIRSNKVCPIQFQMLAYWLMLYWMTSTNLILDFLTGLLIQVLKMNKKLTSQSTRMSLRSADL